MAVFGSIPTDNVQDQSLEQFCEWKTEKNRKFRNVCQATDNSLRALSDWAANSSKVHHKMKTYLTLLLYVNVLCIR